MAKPHDERRSELILTARGLFFSRGYDNCTINDIIDEVGIAKGTFYHYFRSKEELLEAMIDVMADQIMDSVEQIAVDRSRSATERMTDYFRQSMILKAQSPEMMEVMIMYAVMEVRSAMAPEMMVDAVAWKTRWKKNFHASIWSTTGLYYLAPK